MSGHFLKLSVGKLKFIICISYQVTQISFWDFHLKDEIAGQRKEKENFKRLQM